MAHTSYGLKVGWGGTYEEMGGGGLLATFQEYLNNTCPGLI